MEFGESYTNNRTFIDGINLPHVSKIWFNSHLTVKETCQTKMFPYCAHNVTNTAQWRVTQYTSRRNSILCVEAWRGCKIVGKTCRLFF